MENKLVMLSFVFVLFLMQTNLVYAVADTGSIYVNVESMPSLEIKLNGPHVIRSGDTAFIKIKIFNNDSDEKITLNSIRIFDEENKPVISKKSSFTFYGIKKEEVNRLREIQEEIMPIADKDITKVDSTLVNEMQSLDNQIKEKTFIERFNLNVNQFDSNLDGEINFLFSFEFIKEGKKEIATQEFTVRKKPPLPSVSTRHSPGWYAGDNHVHSEHSCFETDITIEENANASKQVGLDWIIITDHGPMIPLCYLLGHGDWDDIRDDCNAEETSSFRCMRGEEISTFTHHTLAYDSPDLEDFVVSCFPLLEIESCVQDKIDNITSQGGIAFIAHPYSSFPWTHWTVTGWTGIEIWNGAFSSDDETSMRNMGGDDDSWEEFLQSETNPSDGFVVGIGNSDTHDADFGNPWAYTYCYMSSLSDSNIISALEDGHCIASNGPLVTFTIKNTIIGDKVDVISGTNTLDIFANSTGFGDLDNITILIDGVVDTVVDVSGPTYSNLVNITLNTENDYVRVEVYTNNSNRAFTNPIWVNVSDCSCTEWEQVGSCGDGGCDPIDKYYERTCVDNCDIETSCNYSVSCEPGPPPGVTNCTPSSCSEGYDDLGISNPYLVDNKYWTRNRTCHKDAQCGSYGSFSSCANRAVYVYDGDQGDSFDTSTCYEFDNYCYKYYSKTQLYVDDWDPGLLGFMAYSARVNASNTWYESSTCSGDQTSPFSTQTSIYTLGRGSNSSGHSASGLYQAFREVNCGGSNDGIEGTLYIWMYRSTASWIPEDYDNQLCDVPYTKEITLDSTIYGDIDANCDIDVEGSYSHPEEIKVKWYVNDNYADEEICDDGGSYDECDDDVGTEWSHTFTLDSSEFEKGDTVYCIARGYSEDGGHGAYNQSSTTTVSNRVPTWSSISLDENYAKQGDNIKVTASGEADLDGDVLALYCCNGGSCTPTTSAHDFCYRAGDSYPYNLYCTGQGVSGNGTQTVRCRIYDGDDYSTIKSDTYEVDNIIPNITDTQANITTAEINESVRVNCTATDSWIGIDSFWIEADKPTSANENYVMSLLSGDTYYVDIQLTEAGIWNFTCWVNDSVNNLANMTDGSVNVLPDDPHKTYHKNSSGSSVAWFGNKGNIVLAGSCYSGGNCDSPGDGSLIFRNSSLDYVGFINATGDLCVETGDCADQNASCGSPVGGSFIIRNSTLDYVSYIDSTGDMCLIGGLYENADL